MDSKLDSIEWPIAQWSAISSLDLILDLIFREAAGDRTGPRGAFSDRLAKFSF